MGKELSMKSQKIFRIVSMSIAGLLGLLLVLSYCLPLVAYSSSKSSENVSQIFLISLDSSYYFQSGSSSSIYINPIGNLLFCILSFLGLFFLTDDSNKLLHYFGYSIILTTALQAFYLHSYVVELAKSFTTDSYFAHPGDVIYLVFAIIALVYAAFVLFNDLFGQKIASVFEASSKRASISDQLTELKSLKDQNLITDEEYAAKRKEILDEK